MSDDREFRAGALSGLLAVIMVVALAVMAMTALSSEPPMRIAQVEQSEANVVVPPGVDSR